MGRIHRHAHPPRPPPPDQFRQPPYPDRPGLPVQALAARLFERTGVRPEQIDTIFLTNFRPAHRAGLAAYPKATLLIHERERDAVGDHLRALLERLEDDAEAQRTLRGELEILGRTRAAEDRLV